MSDIIVTSSNAEKVIASVPADKPILFSPDKNLGAFLAKKTGRDMLLWDGECIVHKAFSLDKIVSLCQEYPNAKLLEMYKSRWDIEVFFKYLKSNFKFQHMKEKEATNISKMYICDSIIIYIAKIIESYNNIKQKIRQKQNDKYTCKLNKSHLVTGIFDELLPKIMKNKINKHTLDDFSNLWVLYQCLWVKKNKFFNAPFRHC